MKELSSEQHDAIEAYLRNQLSAEQRAQFETALTQDSELALGLSVAKELRRQAYREEARQLLQMARRAPVEDNVPEVEPAFADTVPVTNVPVFAGYDSPELMPTTEPRTTWFGQINWAVAAMALLTVGLLGGAIGYWLRYTPTPRSSGTIARNDTVATPPGDSLRNVTAPTLPDVAPAPQLATTDPKALEKALQTAIKPPPAPQLIAEDVDADSNIDSARVARDSAIVSEVVEQFAAGPPTQGQINALRDVFEQGYPSHWRATAEWYLGVAYLSDKQTAKGQAILRRIAATRGHPYQAEARRLRKKLGL